MYILDFVLEYLFVIITSIVLLFIPRYAKIFWNIDISNDLISVKRIQSIDAIRGIAIIAVILIHTCYLLLYNYNEDLEILSLNFINNISRFAIPVFLFTSGLLLKPFIWDKKNIIKFYSSKFIRIGIPYIIVNIALWLIGYNNSAPLWQLILTGGMVLPFYFIPVLFQLYFLYPILDYCRRIIPKYLLLSSVIISIASFLSPFTWWINQFPFFPQFLIFFVYGMLRKDILKKQISNIWGELIIIYIGLQGVFIIFMIYNNVDQNIFKLLHFYNFQMILGFGFIFTALKYLQSNNFVSKLTHHIFVPIGKMSLWIFLLHFPIQQILFDLVKNSDKNFIFVFFHNFVITLFISVFLAFIINKIYHIPKFIKNNL
ncbi:MAG: acyltransferase [Minisyncoccia bacterium]